MLETNMAQGLSPGFTIVDIPSMKLLPRQPQVYLGSCGPFLGKFALGLSKFSVPLEDLNPHLYVVGQTKRSGVNQPAEIYPGI